ncbi:MAG: hypothetical protein EOP20_00320 [Hyphomicrobiales bacterium]|nr:MAG: hypothetical protein EOP20_00320 [Hyphomicrobiales bacterium]
MEIFMNKKSLVLLVLLFVLALMPAVLFATDPSPAVGDAELQLLTMVFTGYIGYGLAFVVVVMGAFTFATGNAKFGVALMFLGVLITLLPMVFNAAHSLVCPAVTALFGGSCGG